MPAPLTVTLIIASVRHGRLGSTVGAWAHAHLETHPDITVDLVDLQDFDIPATLDGSGDTERLRARVAAADAFVVVTPEYNHGYPGYLKTAIDAIGAEWQAKALGFVSYGGGAGGARSTEQLRQVFAELDVVTVREAVVLVRAWDQFDDAGRLADPSGPDGAIRSMLDRLLWWGRTLRTGRESAAQIDDSERGAAARRVLEDAAHV